MRCVHRGTRGQIQEKQSGSAEWFCKTNTRVRMVAGRRIIEFGQRVKGHRNPSNVRRAFSDKRIPRQRDELPPLFLRLSSTLIS